MVKLVFNFVVKHNASYLPSNSVLDKGHGKVFLRKDSFSSCAALSLLLAPKPPRNSLFVSLVMCCSKAF
ncbi:hypothetical protein AQUCO_12400004v1 [Aquilegia coerulea]|uniref:Uncharacterized protein n=1 Tax=Aquilegia coerulea TaxID=218851 RepID=A0A2G5C2V6_AQUCA|nr:hypothetical protein AQUCO_12400004v1 [Aquilegia coerulea]